VRAADVNGRSCPAACRGFAKRRRRLDEYDAPDAPGVRLRVWRQVVDGDGFFPRVFEELQPKQTAETIFLSVKMNVTNVAFWRRASLAAGDIAAALNAQQLASVIHSFAAADWREADHAPATAAAFSAALVRRAGDMRPGDLAAVAKSMVRAQMRRPAALAAVAQAGQQNSRLNGKGFSIILEAFGSLRYRHAGFERRVSDWASSGGLNTCRDDEVVAMTRALTLLGGDLPSDLLNALALRLELLIRTLSIQEVAHVVMACAKLRMGNPSLVRNMEDSLLTDSHFLDVGDLPPVLDSLSRFYADRSGAEEPLNDRQRHRLLAQLSGRIVRYLQVLRPQDACRAIQALDRIDLVDPHLLSSAARLVPARLASLPPSYCAGLLHSYAKAGNSDGFMVSSLRQALLPVMDSGPLVDPAPLEQLDDVEVARLAEDFLTLGHKIGVLATVVAVACPAGGSSKVLAPSCEFALAATAGAAFPSHDAWADAMQSLCEAEPGFLERLVAALSDGMLYRAWCERSVAEAADADTLVLAVCGFKWHSQNSVWARQLADRVQECSTVLLPGLLLAAHGARDEAVAASAESVLLRRLADVDGEVAGKLPTAASVAALRAFAARVEGRGPRERAMLVEAVQTLVVRISSLKAANAKQLVRVLQALERFQLEPPEPLVLRFAEEAVSLAPAELVAALRLLTPRSVRDPRISATLSAMSTRVMPLLRSSRSAWELQSLCQRLGFELGEVDVIAEAEEAAATDVKNSRPTPEPVPGNPKKT